MLYNRESHYFCRYSVFIRWAPDEDLETRRGWRRLPDTLAVRGLHIAGRGMTPDDLDGGEPVGR